MELGRSGGTACPLVVETPPTPSALPAEVREETEEAADSLPLGTTGSCTGSGIRGGLLGVRGGRVAGEEGGGAAGGGGSLAPTAEAR